MFYEHTFCVRSLRLEQDGASEARRKESLQRIQIHIVRGRACIWTKTCSHSMRRRAYITRTVKFPFKNRWTWCGIFHSSHKCDWILWCGRKSFCANRPQAVVVIVSATGGASSPDYWFYDKAGKKREWIGTQRTFRKTQ